MTLVKEEDLLAIIKQGEVFEILRVVQEKLFLSNAKEIIRPSKPKEDGKLEIANLKNSLKKHFGNRYDNLNNEQLVELIIKPSFYMMVGRKKTRA